MICGNCEQHCQFRSKSGFKVTEPPLVRMRAETIRTLVNRLFPLELLPTRAHYAIEQTRSQCGVELGRDPACNLALPGNFVETQAVRCAIVWRVCNFDPLLRLTGQRSSARLGMAGPWEAQPSLSMHGPETTPSEVQRMRALVLTVPTVREQINAAAAVFRI